MYYTMVQVAKIIGIPESTARGYRDRFPSFIETYGQGRSKRYTEKTLEALRIVATMSREGVPFENIEFSLEARFGVAIESRESQQRNVVSQSQNIAGMLSPDEMKELFKQVIQETIGPLQIQNETLQSEVIALRDELKAMEKRQETRENEHYELVDEHLKSFFKEPKKGFWAKLFGL